MRPIDPSPSPVRARPLELEATRRPARLRYRRFEDRAVCTVGLGPCRERGAEDPRAVARAVALGCNVLDTAPQVHRGEHERCVGEAVRLALSAGQCARDGLVVNTAVGRVPDLVHNNIRTLGFARLRALVEERYVARGTFAWHDLADSGHVLAPGFLRHSLGESLARLGLEHVDCVFLDSPTVHRGAVSPREYRRRLTTAFEALEGLCAEGRARCYGIATAVDLDLADLSDLAASIAGPAHRLRAVRVPFSLLRQDLRPLVDAAERLGLYVFAAGCLDGGAPRYQLPDELAARFGDDPDPAAAIRWAQDAPGVGTALFGSRDPRHVQANLAAATRPPLDPLIYRGGPS